MGKRVVRSVGEILESLRASGWLRQTTLAREIDSVWEDVLGEAAEHAKPGAFRKGVLFVAVDSAPWLAELGGFRKANILRQLQEKVKTRLISDIRFRQK